MGPLFTLLHKLIDHAVPAGNQRGEMHDLLKSAAAEQSGAIADTPPPAEPDRSTEPATLVQDGVPHEMPAPVADGQAPAVKFASPKPADGGTGKA